VDKFAHKIESVRDRLASLHQNLTKLRTANDQLQSKIAERKQTEKAMIEKEELLQLVLDNIPQYIFWKDRNSVYLGCNRNFAIIAGLKNPLEIVGKTDYDLPWKKEESDFFRECDARVMETDTPEYHIIEPLLQADGKQSWVNTNKIPLHDAQGNVVGILGTFEDITERQRVEEKIRYQARHDLLTGLPNRTLFNEQLSVSLTQACNSQSMLAVMFLDLDRFNTINDTLGHAVGDRLLQEVAKRLSSCLRQNDILARWGGDEFTLLVSQTNSADEVAKIAQRLLNALKPAFNLEGYSQACRSTSLHISSSIGITLYPQDGEDAETLLRNADAALHRAKQQGRNNFQFYTAAMNSQACELLVLENELHHALKRREFVVYYQPQVNTTTGEITGMEALVRWQHPKFGLVAPDKFIPLAEETGLIVPIGEWVLKTACAQNKAWQDAGLSPLRVAVNLSVRQFQQPLLLNIVSQTLQETGLSPQFLDLEITETIAMQNVELTKAILSELHQMGVYLSIDDFGTGYCSLGYLKQFPLHTLKIDKSFVRDLATDPQNAGIINAIMMLGRGFNLRVIAEGVETEAEKDCLLSFQCEEMQGYLSSPPLPAEEATKLLQNSYSMSGKSSFSV
jgi:diguanylate cyclase (GGDEF)-like protein/PAS domain S-box-containing protein